MGDSREQGVKTIPMVRCPQCGEGVIWRVSSLFRPFCSERCRLIDLGEWATEAYVVPQPLAEWDDNRGEFETDD